jgi:hypothetical protein
MTVEETLIGVQTVVVIGIVVANSLSDSGDKMKIREVRRPFFCSLDIQYQVERASDVTVTQRNR